MQTILAHILSIIRSKKHPRGIWVKPRSQSFWYETMANHRDGENWIKNMRMSNNAITFCAIHSDHKFRKKTQDLVNVIGLDRLTVYSIVHTVCKR